MNAQELFERMNDRSARLALMWLAVGTSFCLSACGGGSSPPSPMVSITVSPSVVTVFSNGTQSFTATVAGTNNTTVMWSVQEGAAGGSITSAGVYTAPQATGAYHVVATSNADNTKSAMASVTVPPVAVAISPNAATVFSNGTQNFTATVTGTTNVAVTWSVQEGAAGGSITSAGIYSAPQAIGTYHVIATSQADSSKSAMAGVNVPPVSVSITPETDTLGPSGKRTFAALVSGTKNTAVTWSVLEAASGGMIDTNGDYIAPSAQGTFHVVVTSVADSTMSATASVTIVPAGFAATGIMAQARFDHTATVLPNGKVLVIGGGGLNSGDALASAELFNPADGTFTATGSMVTARLRHTATLLANGKVLVTGGFDSSGQDLASAELFDPATGSFNVTGPMKTARALHTATLLATGKVLVVGGDNGAGEGLATAELFDPTSGSFTATGSIVTVIGSESQTAILLANGKVLVAGGLAFLFAPLSTAQMYDPLTGAFIATGSMATERTFHTATLLPSGKVFFDGGKDSQAESIATAELFDPGSGSFTSAGSMGAPRDSHTATLLPSGEVLVAGGVEHVTCGDECGINDTLWTTELFNPAQLNFTGAGSLGTARAHHTATLLQNGEVLVVGGLDNSGKALASAELYR